MSASSARLVADLPIMADMIGFKTPWGIVLPPGGKVAAYVRSTGVQAGDDALISGQNLVSTLAAGLDRGRSGLGDTVIVLPGHSESVTDATMLTNLSPGMRILGVGHGSMKPVFRWTATTSQWVFNQNDVMVSGLRLRMEGASGVVKAIAWTGADCRMSDCEIELVSGASNKATIGIEIGTGGDRAEFMHNYVRGIAGTSVTDGLLINAAVTDIRVLHNTMQAAASAANGLIRVAAAALNLDISWNRIYNTLSTSTAAIAFGAVACDGICSYNMVGTKNNGVAAAQGITFGAGSLIVAFENKSCDEPQKSGILTPAVVAT